MKGQIVSIDPPDSVFKLGIRFSTDAQLPPGFTPATWGYNPEELRKVEE